MTGGRCEGFAVMASLFESGQLDPVDFEGEMMTKDIVDLILPHLSNTQKGILFMLLKGFGVREIARTMGITHPAVIKHRRKIARLARELLDESLAPAGVSESMHHSLAVV